jgi:tight adherence protein C
VVSVTATASWALACGLALGLGLWSLVSLLPRLSRPRLLARVAPYVLDVSADARDFHSRAPADPLPVIGMLFAPVLSWLGRVAGTVLGDAETTTRRLRQAGSRLSVAEFRSRQIVWGAIGAGSGIVVALAISRAQATPIALQFVIVVLFAVGGFLGRDFLLQREAKLRMTRMASELPTVLEFLTLSLSAGEGIIDAVRRIARVGSGELAGELAAVVTEVNAGMPFAESLAASADALQLPPFSRCVDQVTGALERGTPLAEVLRAQAQDARDQAKSDLLEVAGKKEVAMLIPLVFLILPTTIAFAIFPGILVLQLGL